MQPSESSDPETNVPEPLTERRTRYLLYCLELYSTPMSLPDIAEQLTVWEQDGRGEGFLQNRLRMYSALHHDHLPALRAAGIVRYNPSTEQVGLGPAAGQYTTVVEDEFETEIGELLEAEQGTFRTN